MWKEPRLPSVRVLRPNNPYKHLKTPPPTSKIGANRPSLRSPACGKDSALALWREVGVGEKQGIQESPGSHTGKKKNKNVRLGGSERTAALTSLAIFAERAGCPRMHSSGPAVVSPCCFANTNYKDWQHSPTPLPPPSTPRSWGHLFLAVPSFPALSSPRLLTVWLLLQRADLGGVGSGGGGVCRAG